MDANQNLDDLNRGIRFISLLIKNKVNIKLVIPILAEINALHHY